MTMRRALPLFVMALLALSASPARAADLTEDSVRAFYKQSADSFKYPYDQYYKNTDESMAATFIAMTKLSIEMPGIKPVVQSGKKTKKELLAEAAQGYDAMKGATLEYQIKSIKIAANRQTADVTTILTIKNMSVTGAPVGIVMNTIGACNDRLIPSAAGKTQLSASSCNIRTVIGKRS